MKQLRTLVTLGLVTGCCAAALAQPAPSSRPLTEEEISQHGRRKMREEYFQERRKSLDPMLNKALARFEAFQERRAAERSLRAVDPFLSWQPFGPAPINNGQTPTSTPRLPSDVTGRVTSIAIDDADDIVYVGAAQGGVWSTADEGATWEPLSDALGSTAVGALAVHNPVPGGDDTVIYLGTGEANGSCDSYGGIGVFKSTDGGATWTGPNGSAEFGNRSISSIAIDRLDPDHLLLTTASGIFGVGCIAAPTLPDRGVFESTNGGTSWTKRTASNLRFSNVLQDPEVATTWWATGWTSGTSVDPANEGGLRKSTDNGVTWTTQVAGTGGLPALATTWARAWLTVTTDASFPGESVLYLANGQTTGAPAVQGRIFKSVDSGDTWAEVMNGRAFCNPQCFYDMPIWVEPGDEQVLYTGGAGTSADGVVPSQFMRSDNGGTTFQDKVRSDDNSTAQHADVHAIVTWPGAPNELWVGNDGGVWRSEDKGNNWINANNNLQITQFSGCDLHPTDRRVVYAGSQDNGTEGRETANNWKHLDFGDGGYARIDQGDPDNLVHTYFNAQNQLIAVGFTTAGFATTMGFYSSSQAPANGISLSDRVLFYAPIHLDRGNSSTLYFGTHRLWRATNFFAAPNSFVAINSAQDHTGGVGAISAIETFANPTPATNATLIYTGSSSGRIHRSTNSGTNWTEVDIGGSALFVSDVLIDPRNSNVVWQSRSGFAGAAELNVRRSTDGGATWNPAATGLPNIPVNALTFDPDVPDRLWAGTDVGAFYTEDGGASWLAHNEGLPTTAIYDLDSNPTTGVMVACTHGRGAFELTNRVLNDGFESADLSKWEP